MPSLDPALRNGLVDVVGDVGDGQAAGGPQAALELEDLHGAQW